MAQNPALPRFDPDGSFDFSWILTSVPGGGRLVANELAQGCVAIYQGADPAAQLRAVQHNIDQAAARVRAAQGGATA